MDQDKPGPTTKQYEGTFWGKKNILKFECDDYTTTYFIKINRTVCFKREWFSVFNTKVNLNCPPIYEHQEWVFFKTPNN